MKKSEKLEKASHLLGASLGILSVIFIFLLSFNNRITATIGICGFLATLILCPPPEILHKASLKVEEKETNNL